MSMPPNGIPDSSSNPNGDFELAQSFQILIGRVEALTTAVESQTTVMQRTASAEARYNVAGARQPQFSSTAMQQIRAAGGVSLQGLSGGTAQISPTGALSSMANLQNFAAQRLGSWLYGTNLFGQPGGQAAAGQAGGSSTPAGTPNSTAAPAGLGAQAAAQAGVAAGTAAAVGGAGGGSPPLTGLPGAIWGPQGPQSRGGNYALASMQLLGARTALSGGAPGGLLSAVKDLPGLGLLSDLYTKGYNTFQSAVYQPGRYYQQIEGGSALGGNQFERLHQAAYQASMAFTSMGPSAAGEAFNAVTSLGYNRAAQGNEQFGAASGQNRMGALDFIYNNYTQTGMPVNQSVQALQTASQNSVIQLNNVTSALKGLSDTAGTAGANANQAREEFQQYFQVAVGQGAAQGAPALAGAVAATQASYGKQFSGTSFAGELGQVRQYLLAGQYGITPGEAQYLQRTSPGQYAGMLAGQNAGFIQQLGIPASDLALLQQMIQQAGGSGAIKLNPDLADQIGNNWLDTDQWAINNGNVNIWASVLSSLTGISLTPANVMAWIVQQLAGNNEAANQVAPGSTQAGSAASTVSASAAASAAIGGKATGARTGRYGLAQATKGSITGSVGGRFGPLNPNQAPGSWQQVLLNHGGGVAQAYLSEEKKSGQRSPVLEALLQNVNKGSQVQVQTSTGPRVMSFEDAMKYYPDELMAGNVMFFNASGSKMLGTTTQITHGLSVPGENVSGEEKQAQGSHLGVSQKAWQKAHPGAYAGASAGKGVTVSLTKEAAQLLKLLPSNSDTASAMGTAPSPPWPSISSR